MLASTSSVWTDNRKVVKRAPQAETWTSGMVQNHANINGAMQYNAVGGVGHTADMKSVSTFGLLQSTAFVPNYGLIEVTLSNSSWPMP